MGGFWSELKRRNVLRVGAAYLVFAWLALQVLSVVGPILELPAWMSRAALVALALGFVAALAFSWIYELTPDGLKRTDAVAHRDSVAAQTGHRLDRLTIAGVVVAIAVVAADRYWPREAPATPTVAQASATPAPAGGATPPDAPPKVEAKSVAVLPFLPLSAGQDDAYFADGLTEEILNALAQLPELLVTARTSAFHFKGKDLPVPEIAATLGVANVLEGSVRRAGGRLRVTAQLIRAADGFHVWSETYDRAEADVFAVQDDIAQRVAGALDVVLDDANRSRMQLAGIRNVEAFIAYQRGAELFELAHQRTAERIALLRQANVEFDRAITVVPDFFPAYHLRADLYGHVLLDPPFAIAGQPPMPADLQEGATGRLRDALDLAYEHARNPGERDAVEVTRIYLSDRWAGLADAMDRLIARPGCVDHLYGDRAALFGKAAVALPFHERQVACDPLNTGDQLAYIQALIWTGGMEHAGRLADAELERSRGNPFLNQFKFISLIGQRDYAGARAFAADNEDYQVMVFAAEGRRDEAQAAAARWRAAGDTGEATRQPVEAWLGERERANAIAAEMDAYPLGPAALTTMIRLCICGAPFDLEATPNFARQLAESGLAWPPPKVLDLPLKSW